MKLGIIGGSGLYELDALKNVKEKKLKTPFGSPSDAYICGRIGNVEVMFLPRHGRGHHILPTEINHRANIFGFKTLGADKIISVSAVGSLKQQYRPRDIVLPDQYFDRTKQSLAHTFFGGGIVAHVSFAEPGCKELRKLIAAVTKKLLPAKGEGARLHVGGTYVNMEGPAFSTRAESNSYRKMSHDIIGMTSIGEAKLCKEAEICYQAISFITDYDCWHEDAAAVTVDMVISNLNANVALAKHVIVSLAGGLDQCCKCGCGSSLQNAIMSNHKIIPAKVKKNLKPIIGKYVK